jgi:hypothetical protein
MAQSVLTGWQGPFPKSRDPTQPSYTPLIGSLALLRCNVGLPEYRSTITRVLVLTYIEINSYSRTLSYATVNAIESPIVRLNIRM